MHKLSHLVRGEWVEHSHPAHFQIVSKQGAAPRIVGGIPSGDSAPFERLVRCLGRPCFLLYVLHTPRGEAEPGRYQSPPLSSEELEEFLARFRSYLTSDARFDLWAHSPSDKATVVWDRHNQLFAYGHVERLAEELRSLGFTEGPVGMDFEHQHHYRPEFDADAAAVIEAFDWSYSPLKPGDVQ